MTNDQLKQLIAAHTEANEAASVMLVSRDRALGDAIAGMQDARVRTFHSVATADDIDISERASLALVARQLEHMSPLTGIHLLCRLRDFHCRHILLALSDHSLSAQELLAIGFYRDSGYGGTGRLFRYDRDEFFEPRQWNTPEDWAHPENFDRNR